MPSTLLSLIIVLTAYGLIKLQEGKNPKLPPLSTPGGEWTRLMAWGIMAIVAVDFLADIITGRYHRFSLSASIQAIVYAILLILLPSLIMPRRKGKSKQRK